jgi:hypothetical protein
MSQRRALRPELADLRAAPAPLTWRFGPEQARRIDRPTLYIGGSESVVRRGL